MTDRELIVKMWNEACTDGLWAAPWNKSIDDLSPEQAAWTPAPGRKSIWQLVLHMVFWRESWLRRLKTGQKPTPEETGTLNFPAIERTTPDRMAAAWADAKRRFHDSQRAIGEAITAGKSSPAGDASDTLMYFLPHDCYHFGQINYLRAMQGLKPIE